MWFYLSLATSLVSAFAVIFSKKALSGVSPSVLTWCTLLFSTPIIAIFAFKEGFPGLNTVFFLAIIGSVLFYTVSTVIEFRAMQISDLSEVYPLVVLGPILTLLVAFFPPLSEKPGFIAIIGVFVTLLGTYILNVGNAKEGMLKPIKLLFTNKASKLMILSVLLGSIVIAFDKLAINNTAPQNTVFVLLAENVVIIIGLLPILYLRDKNFVQQIFNNKLLFVVLGILNAVSTILAFSAVGGGNVGIVSTILKAQLIFVLLLSFIFFKNKPRTETIIGSLIMILGVVLIKIGV